MSNGINPSDLGFLQVPSVAGSRQGRVIVCGSARCLWDDLSRLPSNAPAEFCAVKQTGMYLPFKIQHWVGCHGERFQFMVPLRKMENGENHYYLKGYLEDGTRGVHSVKYGIQVHAEKNWPMVDHVWTAKALTGTSALFATKIMLALGYEEVILAGVPLDDSGRFYDAPWNKGCDLNPMSLREWEEFVPVFDGRVKSMSGRTRELLGGI